MKKSKRILAFILSMILIFSMTGISSLAADEQVAPRGASSQTKSKTYTYNYYNSAGTKLATLKVTVTGTYSSVERWATVDKITRTLTGTYASNFTTSSPIYNHYSTYSIGSMTVKYQGTSIGTYKYKLNTGGSITQTSPDYNDATTVNLTIV